jgi:hypothetical protein
MYFSPLANWTFLVIADAKDGDSMAKIDDDGW